MILWSATRRRGRPATSSTCGRRPSRRSGCWASTSTDLGAPCQSEFRNATGKVRVRGQPARGRRRRLRRRVHRPAAARSSTSGCSPPCRRACCRSTARSTCFDQDETGVTAARSPTARTEKYDVLVGADGIDSLVRRTLWGDAPKREHNLHIFGGFTFDDALDIETRAVHRLPQPHHPGQLDRRSGTRAATASSGGCSPRTTPTTEFTGDLHATATAMAAAFAAPLPQLIAATDPANVQRWVMRDRKPLKQWSQGPGHPRRRRRPPDLALRRLRRRHGHRGRLLPRPPPRRRRPVRPRRRRRAALDATRRPGKPHTARQVADRPTCSARCSTTPRAAAARCATPSSTTRRSCRR